MALTDSQLKRLRKTPVGTTGNRVAAAIDLLDMTQMAVAEAAGLPQQYVSDVARGAYTTVTVTKAHKLAAFFGCQIEDLFPSREAMSA